MPWGPGKKTPSSELPDRACNKREAAREDADKTEGEDRDLVHGEGGTLGLDNGEDLNQDD
jgi:hypothetical protein